MNDAAQLAPNLPGSIAHRAASSRTGILHCEIRACPSKTANAQQGLLAGDGWRIERVGNEMVIVCPRHNWRENGVLVHG